METRTEIEARGIPAAVVGPRARLLEGVPLDEKRIVAAGIRTLVLEGGAGPPLLLLHGPGESAVNWRWVVPDLVETHRVVAPDLPAHGSTSAGDGELHADRILGWMDALIERTCAAPPVVVGHVLGGAIAARYAVDRGDRLRGLVLVDSLGLARFRPSLRFLLGFIGFTLRPTTGSYRRFMRQCAYDLDALRERVGGKWDPFEEYNLQLARDASSATGRLFRRLGLPRIPPDDLAAIDAPVALIWGREDRALRLSIAEEASERYGWPLHVIDRAADDPARDRPEAFLEALSAAMTRM